MKLITSQTRIKKCRESFLLIRNLSCSVREKKALFKDIIIDVRTFSQISYVKGEVV